MSADRAPLPVDAVVGAVRAALDDPGAVVVQAPPGAGKTTRLPLALLPGLRGRLLLLEPRRVAARAAAARLAAELDEPVGQTVGVTTRQDRRVSDRTRIEVVTEGVVLRRLQRDPALTDVDVLFFDEFHERSLEADLALAFALDSRQALRPDLRLLVASATLEDDRVAGLLGGAPVVRAEGRQFPVEVEHRPAPPRDGLADAVAATALELTDDGDVLVFLPGVREIRAAARALAERDPRWGGRPIEILTLHGAASPEEQDRALQPASDGARRIVLATDIAETSLTIEGIRGVVDAGLQRRPRHDPRTGLTGLVTVRASQASATQRAGRAGRVAPGRAVRLWPAADHRQRDVHTAPAMLTDDLTGPALQVAAWGADVSELALLDPPPGDLWAAAQGTLGELGMLREGRITAHGQRAAALPVHPRLAQLLLMGRRHGLADLAADLAALLTERDVVQGTDTQPPPADLALRVELLRGTSPPSGLRLRRGALRRARQDARRLRRLIAAEGDSPPDRAGELVALAWPDRVAGRRLVQGVANDAGNDRARYLLATGRGATLPPQDRLGREPWLAVAAVDRGQTEARVALAVPIDRDRLVALLPDRIATVTEVAWRGGDVVAEQRRQLGALVLDRQALPAPDPQARIGALLDGLRAEGLGLLDWDDDARQLQARILLLRRQLGPAWPDVSDDGLLARADEVIAPFLLGVRNRAGLGRTAASEILRAQLRGDQFRELDRLCPPRLTMPAGTSARVDYTADPGPVLAVRVQELFGARQTPAVVDGQVPLLVHLLSPARRPVQITDDLAGFWQRAYPQVRAELRGRYPKHDWPEDPLAARPGRRQRGR